MRAVCGESTLRPVGLMLIVHRERVLGGHLFEWPGREARVMLVMGVEVMVARRRGGHGRMGSRHSAKGHRGVRRLST